MIENILPGNGAILLGRVWNPDVQGPSIITVRDGNVYDITTCDAPTVSDICEMDDAASYVTKTPGINLGAFGEIASVRIGDADKVHLLAPCDLQPVKACGVTFAGSMIERVIEEQAAGDPKKAEKIRGRVNAIIGDSLSNIEAGSKAAENVKKELMGEGLWSQYLEVGIGPDAEVFSKAQVLSAVGHNADVGLHPVSNWNNPEPEVVLTVASTGRIVGAALGNDVNLRDVEGRSALLLSKAKDNNASCSIGPMIRLFDENFNLDAVRSAELMLTVTGAKDGYVLEGRSSMREISRDPENLVAQVVGAHHQYPDGFMLMLGTLFAPTQDRDVSGEGFTHKVGDRVEIASPEFGRLINTVQLATQCAPWAFGSRALMRNLANRNLI